MPMRWCQDCRELFDMDSTGTLRCPDCQARTTARRNARPSSSKRGLGWAFTARKTKDRNYQEASTCQCTGQCHRHHGTCGQPFTADNPKTAGHTVPRIRGGGDSPIIAMCRTCNSAEGGHLASR